MQKNQKYIIFLDIDGTIWEYGTDIHTKTITTVQKARESGHEVFINTGRSYGFIPLHIFEQMSFDGVVAGLGADVRIGESQLLGKSVAGEQLEKTYDFMIKRNKIGLFEGERTVFSINLPNEANFIKIKDKQHFSSILNSNTADLKISKINIKGVLSDEDRSFLEQFYSVIQHETYSEMAIPGITKASGMEVVINALAGEGDFKVIACGDSLNDIEMLERADISVAMGNAVEKVKQLSDIVTDTVTNGGVGVALEQILGL